MSRIYWDTMLFVYWIEGHPVYAPKVKSIFEKMDQRGDALCTSVFTLGELLIGPKKRRAPAVEQQFRDFFRETQVDLLPFTESTVEHYADIRAVHRIPAADAIHLASAAQHGVDLFLTNDHRLRGLVIPGIQFTAGMETDLF